MICPNCSVEIKDDINVDAVACSNCGVDVILFQRIIDLSNYYYNIGLEYANKRDFTKAVSFLKKSTMFNKNNYQSRNLLGVIYYELGLVAEALKQWSISKTTYDVPENLAHGYMDLIEKHSGEIDDLNSSCAMYNQALVYINQKSDDLAVIQLKKALELNPNFVDAMNLLSFCFCIQKNKEQALAMSKDVLAIDHTNPIALNYYKELAGRTKSPAPPKKDKEKDVKDSDSKEDTVQATEKDNYKTLFPAPTPADKETYKALFPTSTTEKKLLGNNAYFGSILSFVSGALCSLALFFILILPSSLSDLENEILNLQAGYDMEKTTWIAKEDEFEKTISTLETEKANLFSEIQNITSQLSLAERSERLAVVDALILSKDYVEAAEAIYLLDTTGLTDEDLQTLEDYKSVAYPVACEKSVDDAINLLGAATFSDSAAILEHALVYAEYAQNLKPQVIYYLGRAAEGNKDYSSASTYYETVINDYPDSSIVTSAKRQLNGIND